MTHVSYTELRSNLARYMEEVCDSRAPLLVTRQNARAVVMVSAAEFEGMRRLCISCGLRPMPLVCLTQSVKRIAAT